MDTKEETMGKLSPIEQSSNDLYAALFTTDFDAVFDEVQARHTPEDWAHVVHDTFGRVNAVLLQLMEAYAKVQNTADEIRVAARV